MRIETGRSCEYRDGIQERGKKKEDPSEHNALDEESDVENKSLDVYGQSLKGWILESG